MDGTPRFVDLEELTLAGVCGWFSKNAHDEIPKLWHRFSSRKGGCVVPESGQSYGAIFGHKRGDKGPASFFYLAAVKLDEAPDTKDLPEFVVKTIPAQSYVVFTHEGPVSELPETLDFVFQEWFPDNDAEYAFINDAPSLEFYDQRFKPDSYESAFDLYFPIRKREQAAAPEASEAPEAPTEAPTDAAADAPSEPESSAEDTSAADENTEADASTEKAHAESDS